MRKALNENPMVQIGVLALIAVAFAFILFTKVLGGKDDSAPADPAAASAAATTAAAASGAAPQTDPATGAPVGGEQAVVAPAAIPAGAAPAGGSVGTSDGLLPTKGLPEDVLVAYARDRAIALLVIDPKSLSAAKLDAFTRRLGAQGAEVFVVPVRQIARYSRITAGVSVSRAPALIVIRPRELTGSVPTASVSYGFRGPRSVAQALDDALYRGDQIPAYP